MSSCLPFLPWLKRHNPQFDWASGKVVSWSTFCHSTCLQSALSPAEGGVPLPQEPPDLYLVPPIYHDLGEVFSKCRALALPPHRPYDCAIDLLPGAPLPSSRLYNSSRPEREAMEKYIKDSLLAGLMRPSSSPVGAVQVSFLLLKRTSLFAHVLISGDSIALQLRTSMPCPSSVPHSSRCRALQSSLNWIYAMPNT